MGILLDSDPDLFEWKVCTDFLGQSEVMPSNASNDIIRLPHTKPEVVVPGGATRFPRQPAPSNQQALGGIAVLGHGAEQLTHRRVADGRLLAFDLHD